MSESTVVHSSDVAPSVVSLQTESDISCISTTKPPPVVLLTPESPPPNSQNNALSRILYAPHTLVPAATSVVASPATPSGVANASARTKIGGYQGSSSGGAIVCGRAESLIASTVDMESVLSSTGKS